MPSYTPLSETSSSVRLRIIAGTLLYIATRLYIKVYLCLELLHALVHCRHRLRGTLTIPTLVSLVALFCNGALPITKKYSSIDRYTLIIRRASSLSAYTFSLDNSLVRASVRSARWPLNACLIERHLSALPSYSIVPDKRGCDGLGSASSFHTRLSRRVLHDCYTVQSILRIVSLPAKRPPASSASI